MLENHACTCLFVWLVVIVIDALWLSAIVTCLLCCSFRPELLITTGHSLTMAPRRSRTPALRAFSQQPVQRRRRPSSRPRNDVASRDVVRRMEEENSQLLRKIEQVTKANLRLVDKNSFLNKCLEETSEELRDVEAKCTRLTRQLCEADSEKRCQTEMYQSEKAELRRFFQQEGKTFLHWAENLADSDRRSQSIDRSSSAGLSRRRSSPDATGNDYKEEPGVGKRDADTPAADDGGEREEEVAKAHAVAAGDGE